MGNKQKKPDLMDVSLELKMTSKQLEKQSQKLEMQEKAERKKIIDVSNTSDSQRVGPEQKPNGERKGFRWKRDQESQRSNKSTPLWSQDGCPCFKVRVSLSNSRNQQHNSSIRSPTAELYEENGCDWRKFASSNFFKVAGSVGDFEKLFEDMDVKTEEMNGALDNVYATSIDNNEVMNLLNEMRD
mgnify:CR=1 FL=1